MPTARGALARLVPGGMSCTTGLALGGSWASATSAAASQVTFWQPASPQSYSPSAQRLTMVTLRKVVADCLVGEPLQRVGGGGRAARQQAWR